MHETHPRRARLLALILLTVVALFAAACGDSGTENGSTDSGAEGSDSDAEGSDSDAAASDAAGDTAGSELEGSFLVSGSSTVYPIALEQAEASGVLVAMSHRGGRGRVQTGRPFPSADNLTPQKARILLMLALANGATRDSLEEIFLSY